MERKQSDIAFFVVDIRESERKGEYVAERMPTMETVSIIRDHYSKLPATFCGKTVYRLLDQYAVEQMRKEK